MNNYVVYLLRRSRNKSELYVGKGRSDRPYEHVNLAKRGRHSNKYLMRTINKDLRQGYGEPIVEILAKNIDESTAHFKEKYFIRIFGRRDQQRGPLLNMTDGGEGFKGLVKTEEHRLKLSKALTGKVRSDETKARISAVKKGLTPWKGRNHTQESKDKIAAAQLGNKRKPHSYETREKMRAAARGRVISTEQRHKISNSRRANCLARKLGLTKEQVDGWFLI